MEFINQYQTLIGTFLGSFLAILSSVFLWLLKENYEKNRQLKNNKKEIESIFLMAVRDSQESMGDLQHVIPKIKESIKKITLKSEVGFFALPRLNRVFFGEERLSELRQGLDFVTEQQVEIAISSAKKFNGYMEQFEFGPSFIFDNTLKLLNSNLITLDEIVKEYKDNATRWINGVEEMLSTHLETAQRNMLRPVVVQVPKKDLKVLNKRRGEELDEELNTRAAFLLAAIKKDLE